MPFLTTWETGILYITENRNIVHQWKQEFCTTQKTGILYNTENRNFVQHRNQEYCTSLIYWGVWMGLVLFTTWMSSMLLLEVGYLSCILLRLVAGRLPTYATGRVDGSRISCFGAISKEAIFYPSFVYCILLPQLYILHILCQTVTLSKFSRKCVVVSPHTCCPQPCPQTVVAIGNVS